jgi:hypothetical protein
MQHEPSHVPTPCCHRHTPLTGSGIAAARSVYPRSPRTDARAEPTGSRSGAPATCHAPPCHSGAGGNPASRSPAPWFQTNPTPTWIPACAGMTATGTQRQRTDRQACRTDRVPQQCPGHVPRTDPSFPRRPVSLTVVPDKPNVNVAPRLRGDDGRGDAPRSRIAVHVGSGNDPAPATATDRSVIPAQAGVRQAGLPHRGSRQTQHQRGSPPARG